MAARAHMSYRDMFHPTEARTPTAELFATGAFMVHIAELARSDARNHRPFG
jgi:hypothetical protein